MSGIHQCKYIFIRSLESVCLYLCVTVNVPWKYCTVYLKMFSISLSDQGSNYIYIVFQLLSNTFSRYAFQYFFFESTNSWVLNSIWKYIRKLLACILKYKYLNTCKYLNPGLFGPKGILNVFGNKYLKKVVNRKLFENTFIYFKYK